MGCYYLAANLDKREKVTTDFSNHSEKIGGWCWSKPPDSPTCALLFLLRSRWAGDRIVLAADEYASTAGIYDEATDSYTDVTEIGRRMARAELDRKT